MRGTCMDSGAPFDLGPAGHSGHQRERDEHCSRPRVQCRCDSHALTRVSMRQSRRRNDEMQERCVAHAPCESNNTARRIFTALRA